MLYEEDINELKRIAVNTYESDKAAQLYRIINGINALKGTIQSLQAENALLKQNAAKL
jgi:hypothetical protein